MNKTIKLLLFLFLVITKTAFAQTKPTDLTGLKLWLDASNVNNDGTTPLDNDFVTTWKDRSGSGNNATVLLGKNAGTFVSNQINGKSVVRFNRVSNTSGSVYQILGLDIRAMTLPKITIFTVYKQGALAGDDQAIWGCDDGNWDRFFFSSFPTYPTTANNGGVSQGTFATLIPNSGVVGTTQLLTAIYDSPNDQGSAIYFNGKSVANFVDKTTTGTDAQPNLRIGFDGDNNCYNGDIAEMIVYNRVLNACEIQEINHYLANKYAVPFSTVAVSISGGTSFPQGGSVTLSTSTAGTSYQWLLNGTAISGATSSSYVAKATGNYQVAVTNSCTDTSTVQALTELPPVVPVSGGNVTVTYTGNTSNNISATGNTGTTVDWYDAATAGTKVATGVSTSTATTYTVTQKPVGTYTYYAEAREISTGNVSTTRTAVKVIINPAPITVTASDVSKPYGTTLTNGTSTTGFSVSGMQNSETIGSVSLAYGTGAAATASAGTYASAITPSAATGGTFTLSNYTITYKPGKITITPVALTVNATAQSKAYGDADPVLGYTITSGSLVGTDAFTGALTRVAGENAGSYAINQGTLALNGNYTLTFNPANLSIGTKNIAVTAVPGSKIYGDADPVLGYTITSGSLVGTDAFTGTLTRVAGENAGTYAINQGTLALNSNYNLTFNSANLAIEAKSIAVTADAQSKTYGDADPALTYTIPSGSLVGTDAFTGTLSRIAGENVGTYAINQGTLALNGNYSITFNPANLSIGTKTIAVTASAKSKTYGDADPALTYTITSGSLVGTDAFTGTLSRIAGENVGTYAINQGTLALNGNYSITFNPANLSIGTKTIAVTASAQSKVYGAADPVLTYTITSGSLVGTDAFTGTLSRVAGENVGSYAINQGNLALNTNYSLTFNPANLSIGTKTIAVTASAQSKVYGAADPVLTYTITSGSLVGTDAFTGTLSRVAGENVGTYAINQGTLALTTNYSLSVNPASLSITPKSLVITAANQSKAYGAVNPTLTLSYNGFAGTDNSSSLTTQAGAQTTAVTASPAGTYPITASGAQSANYNISYVAGTLTVSPVALTITAANQSKVYGSANPALSVTYSGFVNGDTNTILTTQPTVSTTAVTGSPAGAFPISVSGAAAANYAISYTPGVLTVSKATLAITADNQTRTYGVANPAFTASYSGFVNGDTQASLTTLPTVTSTATTNSAPGQYAITATGAASGNYTFTYNAGTLTITPHTNADLTNLAVSAGTLSPAFATTTFTYAVSVGYSTTSINLTPTLSDNTASVTINGAANSSGTASADIALAVGYNTIVVMSTAQDGVTKKTYTVVVYRGEPQDQIVATNVLTPNGDGKNDNWVIKDIQLYPANNVTIYDKGGRVIFSKSGYANDWNGTLNGAPLTEGTYYYIVDLGPGLRKFKGFISILRSR